MLGDFAHLNDGQAHPAGISLAGAALTWAAESRRVPALAFHTPADLPSADARPLCGSFRRRIQLGEPRCNRPGLILSPELGAHDRRLSWPALAAFLLLTDHDSRSRAHACQHEAVCEPYSYTRSETASCFGAGRSQSGTHSHRHIFRSGRRRDRGRRGLRGLVTVLVAPWGHRWSLSIDPRTLALSRASGRGVESFRRLLTCPHTHRKFTPEASSSAYRTA